jgi:hypothetical protein
MVQALDREGTFRLRPLAWEVRSFANSKATAINVKLRVTEQWDEASQSWVDWSAFEEYHVYGDYFVLKKDGTVNQVTVEQLARSLGWDGTFKQVATQPPPDVVVVVTVEPDVYKGNTRYRAGWMNPGDHVPGGSDRAAAPEATRQLDAQFGSMLRAAAATAKPKAAGKPPAPPPPKGGIGDGIAPATEAEAARIASGPSGGSFDTAPWSEGTETFLPPEEAAADARSRQ